MTSEALPGPHRLRKRADFVRAASGLRRHAKAFALQRVPRDPIDGGARFGFTVTKKVGGAVERNRIRRRLRAALAGLPADCSAAGHDYVIVARREALSLAFADLQADLCRAITDIGQARPARPKPTTKRMDQASHP